MSLEMLHTYMITGPGAGEHVIDCVVRALDAGVERVQVRRKQASGASLEAMVDAILERRSDARNKLLVNDRLDVALAKGLAGVHLPADGLSAASVRRVVARAFEVGVSVHDVEAARRAASDGADFLVFGPVFETASKPGRPGVGLARLKEVVDAVPVPVYALGGITPAAIASVAETGAFGVAGISVFENEQTLRELLSCR